jgi:hypothetical protein
MNRATLEINQFKEDAIEVYMDALKVLVKKQIDYGSKNISNAPGGAMMGLAVRLHDKISRLANLLENDIDPNNESIEDTFLDIANYGMIGLMILKEKWPNK